MVDYLTDFYKAFSEYSLYKLNLLKKLKRQPFAGVLVIAIEFIISRGMVPLFTYSLIPISNAAPILSLSPVKAAISNEMTSQGERPKPKV